jgi:hypothetical protein
MKSCNAIVIGSGQGGVPLATNLGGSRLVGHSDREGRGRRVVHQLRLHADQDHDLKRPHCPLRAGRTRVWHPPGRIKVDIAAVVAHE